MNAQMATAPCSRGKLIIASAWRGKSVFPRLIGAARWPTPKAHRLLHGHTGHAAGHCSRLNASTKDLRSAQSSVL